MGVEVHKVWLYVLLKLPEGKQGEVSSLWKQDQKGLVIL